MERNEIWNIKGTNEVQWKVKAFHLVQGASETLKITENRDPNEVHILLDIRKNIILIRSFVWNIRSK